VVAASHLGAARKSVEITIARDRLRAAIGRAKHNIDSALSRAAEAELVLL